MRRALVLTNESARHPMRASIPQRRSAFADLPPLKPAGRSSPQLNRTPDWRISADDIRGVASTYFATFAAVLAFII